MLFPPWVVAEIGKASGGDIGFEMILIHTLPLWRPHGIETMATSGYHDSPSRSVAV